MDQREAFRVLASADRQLVLHELVERGGEATVETLSRQVAARRHRIPSTTVDADKVARARIRLVHIHVPILQETDVATVDYDEEAVILTENASLDRLFDAADQLDSWPPDDLLKQPSESR